jgi:hypothetical protein
MNLMKKLIYILGFSLALMPFQNCGVLNQQGYSILSNEKSGNGGGYEGKPDGTYYHYIPSYTCEGRPAAEQITEIKDGQAFVYVNKDTQCANQSSPVPVDDINVSPFQNEFISVKDSLFKRYEEKPAGIPNNLAEVLCRDNFETPTFEIVSHYDREKNEAFTRVYLPGQQVSDFSVSRILSSNQVRYVAGNISFNVDLSKPAFSVRKFAGQVENTSITGVSVRPLVCVIGGSIDTSQWSLKALANIDAGSFQVMNNNEILFFSEVSRYYFTSTLYQTVTHLFKIGLDNVVSDFSKLVFGNEYDFKTQNGKVNDVLYFFSAKKTSEGWTSSFFYDSRTGKYKRLTNLKTGADPEQYESRAPVLTSDQHLFYDTQVIHPTMESSPVVRVYNFNDDLIEDIATLSSRHEDTYVALPKTNQLVIFWHLKNSLTNVIQVYDAKSKISKDLPLKMQPNCSLLEFPEGPLSDESRVLAIQFCDGIHRNIIEISINDGSVKVLGPDSSITWASEDGHRIVMTDATKKNLAYDFRTGKTTALPIDPGFGANGLSSGITDFMLLNATSKMALANDQWLYGFGGNVEAPTMYQVDLQSGASVAVCEGALGKKLFVGKLPNQKIFLFTYEDALKVYRFYQVKSSSECARINEFPSAYPNVPKLVSTNIGFGLLLGLPITRSTDQTAVEAVFVPMDGRPPLKFNSGSVGKWQIDVSADRNRIVLRGPDLDNVVKIFSFDL